MTSTEAGSPEQGTRVVIVDDHAIFRSGLKADLDPSIVVAGEAGTVEEAIAVIAAVRPDVVLLDVHLPGGLGGGGREVLAGSAPLLGSTRFLALSVSDAAEDVVSVIRAGARGYSYKEVAKELFISIKTVETHVSAVLRKLQLSSRHELTRWAAERRLL